MQLSANNIVCEDQVSHFFLNFIFLFFEVGAGG